MTRDSFSYTHGDTGTAPSSSLNFEVNERPQAQHFDWWWTEVIEAINGHASEFTRIDSNDDGVVDETDTVAAGGNLKGDLKAVNGEIIWDESTGYIPQNQLQNDDITLNAGTGISSAGNVSLGGSVTISVNDSRYVHAAGDQMTGVLDMNGNAIEDSTGVLTLSGGVNVTGNLQEGGSDVATQSWVNSNADVPDADYADSAGDADTLDGHSSGYFTTLTEVNNNADVPNADYADTAGDANTLDGNDSSHFTTLTEVNNNADVPNADYADNAGDADTLDGNHANEIGMSMGKMDSAETFTESDVTTQLNNTTVSGGSVNLNETFSSTPDYPYYVNDGSAPNEGGWVINPDMPIATMDIGVNITSTTDGTFKVIRLSDDTTLVSQSFTSENVSRVTFDSPLQTGTDYAIVVAPDGHGGNGERYDEQPTDTGAYTVPSGYADGSHPTSGWYINNIDVEVYNTSGTISVEWPSPTDIYSWDRATFQSADNGGSADIYIEESTDGGSTWTEVAGPISRGDPITSSADAEVRFRVDLSRPSTSDTTPTLDSIYRRYEV
jgi:hypothetical protein